MIFLVSHIQSEMPRGNGHADGPTREHVGERRLDRGGRETTQTAKYGPNSV